MIFKLELNRVRWEIKKYIILVPIRVLKGLKYNWFGNIFWRRKKHRIITDEFWKDFQIKTKSCSVRKFEIKKDIILVPIRVLKGLKYNWFGNILWRRKKHKIISDYKKWSTHYTFLMGIYIDYNRGNFLHQLWVYEVPLHSKQYINSSYCSVFFKIMSNTRELCCQCPILL